MAHLAPAFRAAGGAADVEASAFGTQDMPTVLPVDTRTDLTLWMFLGGRWSPGVLMAITAANAAKQQGNEHFAASRLDEAALAYTDALSLLPEDKAFDESRVCSYFREVCFQPSMMLCSVWLL
jgi:hypothetical protein